MLVERRDRGLPAARSAPAPAPAPRPASAPATHGHAVGRRTPEPVATADEPLAAALARAVLARNNHDGGEEDRPVHQTVQILYTKDHAARARAMESALPEARASLVSDEPTAIRGLKTLVLWGHGTSVSLCDLGTDAMADLIQRWRKLNSSLQSIDIVTCNARHYAPQGTKQVEFNDSYVNRLKVALKSRGRATRKLTMRALPITVTGERNAWSILLAEAATKSWVYVTAPGETEDALLDAAALIQLDDSGQSAFHGDIAQRADEMVRAHPDRKWTMTYGYFGDLRRSLVVV